MTAALQQIVEPKPEVVRARVALLTSLGESLSASTFQVPAVATHRTVDSVLRLGRRSLPSMDDFLCRFAILRSKRIQAQVEASSSARILDTLLRLSASRYASTITPFPAGCCDLR